jgi:hypothetical protein
MNSRGESLEPFPVGSTNETIVDSAVGSFRGNHHCIAAGLLLAAV